MAIFFKNLVLETKRARDDQPWSLLCLFMSLHKDVSKYTEFPNLDTALDFQLHGKDCSVERNISISVCLYPKIRPGFIYKMFWVFFEHQHLPTRTLAGFSCCRGWGQSTSWKTQKESTPWWTFEWWTFVFQRLPMDKYRQDTLIKVPLNPEG